MDEQKEHINCRVCLRRDLNETDKCFSLFEEHNNVLISEKIKYIATVEIEQNDGKPDKICPDCILQLETAIIFKQKCEHSDKILKSVPSEMFKDFRPLLEVKKELKVVLEELPIDMVDKLDEDLPICSDTDENASELPEDTPCYDPQSEPVVKNSRAIDLKLICDDCGESFKSKCKMAVHWKKVHLPTKLVCSSCKRMFKSVTAFNRHAKTKTRHCLNSTKIRTDGQGRQRVFHCLECSYKTKRTRDMDIHLIIHDVDRRYKCSECPKTFTQYGTLQRHMESCHKEISKTLFERTCHFCGKVIKMRWKYYQHLRSHRPKSLPCEVCKQLFNNQASLRQHMIRHSGMKNFICEICSSRFYTQSDVLNHRRVVHYKKKIFKCKFCDYTMHSSEIKKRHESKHTPTNGACYTCGKFFEDLQKLDLHEKKHLISNYICSHCDRGFYRKDTLSMHITAKHKDVLAPLAKQVTNKISLKKVKQELQKNEKKEIIDRAKIEPTEEHSIFGSML